MNSLIIVSKNSESALEKVTQICKQQNIAPIDQDTSTFEKAIGIQDVIGIQKKLFFKPIKSKDKAVIIDAPFGFTTEAQNALLKILEEPPQNTFIIIVAPALNSFLPTVLSRCKIIEIKDETGFDEKELSGFKEILENLDSKGISEKLKLAQDFGTSREEALIFLERLIFNARNKLIENPTDQRALQNLKMFQEVYSVIKTTNATPRLSLENLFLSL